MAVEDRYTRYDHRLLASDRLVAEFTIPRTAQSIASFWIKLKLVLMGWFLCFIGQVVSKRGIPLAAKKQGGEAGTVLGLCACVTKGGVCIRGLWYNANRKKKKKSEGVFFHSLFWFEGWI